MSDVTSVTVRVSDSGAAAEFDRGQEADCNRREASLGPAPQPPHDQPMTNLSVWATRVAQSAGFEP